LKLCNWLSERYGPVDRRTSDVVHGQLSKIVRWTQNTLSA